MAHQFYEPNEYESMYIAAGWIDMEDVDPDYQKYVKNDPYPEYKLTYEQWRDSVKELEALGARWDKEIDPLLLPGTYMNYEQKRLMDKLSKQLSDLEFRLGF